MNSRQAYESDCFRLCDLKTLLLLVIFFETTRCNAIISVCHIPWDCPMLCYYHCMIYPLRLYDLMELLLHPPRLWFDGIVVARHTHPRPPHPHETERFNINIVNLLFSTSYPMYCSQQIFYISVTCTYLYFTVIANVILSWRNCLNMLYFLWNICILHIFRSYCRPSAL